LRRIPNARSELATVLAFVERSVEQRHLPEPYRLEGECLRRGGLGVNGSRPSDVQACFDHALLLARQQGARLWELPAAISAADFLVSEGAAGGARAARHPVVVVPSVVLVT
jgi:hypothetical protein